MSKATFSTGETELFDIDTNRGEEKKVESTASYAALGSFVLLVLTMLTLGAKEGGSLRLLGTMMVGILAMAITLVPLGIAVFTPKPWSAAMLMVASTVMASGSVAVMLVYRARKHKTLALVN